MKKSLSLAALSAAMLSAPLASQAATETDTFNVLLNVIGACAIDSASDMDFGSLTEAEVNAGSVTATSAVNVTCSTGTTYTINLSGENGVDRDMVGGATNGTSVAYELFQADGVTLWDPSTAVSGTGDGLSQSYAVEGNIPAQTMTLDPADAATYQSSTGLDLSDTITVTLTF